MEILGASIGLRGLIRSFSIDYLRIYQRVRVEEHERHDVRGTPATKRNPKEGFGRGEGSSNRGNIRMLRLGNTGPSDGQRARFLGILKSQERRLRQVSLRSESLDGHEYQSVSHDTD